VQEWNSFHSSADCNDQASTDYNRNSATYVSALKKILLTEGWFLARTTFSVSLQHLLWKEL